MKSVPLYSKGSPWKLRGPPSARVSYDQTSFPVRLSNAYSLPAHDPMKRRLPLTVGAAKIQPPVSNCHITCPLAELTCPAARHAIVARTAMHSIFTSFFSRLPPAIAPPHQSPPEPCCRADCGCCKKWKTQTACLFPSAHNPKAHSRG